MLEETCGRSDSADAERRAPPWSFDSRARARLVDLRPVPSLLARCTALLRVPANEIAFAVRTGLAWSRGTPVLPDEDKADPFAHRPPDERAANELRAAALARRFDLAALHARSTIAVWTGNLALLEHLEALTADVALPVSADGAVRAVDVGSGDFHYATALQRWLAQHGTDTARTVVLRGFELDGHGVYRDGHSRADHARAHAALASRGSGLVRYEVADVLRVALPEQDVVTLLYPFVFCYPLLRWGLPLSRFRPRRLVHRAVAMLRPGGLLVVANQTDTEFERLRALLAEEAVEFVRCVPFATDLVPAAERTHFRIGSLWRKRG